MLIRSLPFTCYDVCKLLNLWSSCVINSQLYPALKVCIRASRSLLFCIFAMTLPISYPPYGKGLPYFICVFLVATPFVPCYSFFFNLVTLTLTFDLLLKTLVITFEQKYVGLSYSTCVIAMARPFT